jgi:hypothetical protein
MNMALRFRFTILLFTGVVLARAQFGPTGGAPDIQLSGATAKLFGDNSAFTATMEMQMKEKSGNLVVVPGNLAFLEGKSRFDIDLTKIKASSMRPEMGAQLAQFGMASLVMINRPEKKSSYLIYPGLQGYVENPIKDPALTKTAADFTIESTELGKETVDGHECAKNKVVVTDKDGNKQEFTVWNASDLKQFPVKLEMGQTNALTMTFKNVKLEKPEAGVFDPPSDATKYDSVPALMQQGIMKKFSGGLGAPK